jgi:Fic family protein
MEKNRPTHLQEILFGSADKAESKRISDLVKNGIAKKIASRIYTTNLNDAPSTIIRRNWFRILAAQYPKSLLSHRSALECKPTLSGQIYVTHSYTKKISLPGLVVHFQQGHEPIDGDTPFFRELYLSQQARAFLENFQPSRKTNGDSKTLSREQLEEKLESIIRTKGETSLNELRDRARQIAPILEMKKEFEQLDKIISALLSTKPSKFLSSNVAKARAIGEPFDPARIALFEKLYETLAGREYPEFSNKNVSPKAYQSFAFFESYFSNYIEGTEFTVDEAKQIVTSQTPLPGRNEDSHDVLGTYTLVSNRKEMSICPETDDELLKILLYRHDILLSVRIDKNPGQFKDKNNRAGNTEFVDWQLVTGTLKKGFEWYSLLRHPFARAAYIMFLVSEVHPFIDGNGRIARVMMNAELSSKGFSKIIVPTVYREDYMGALRKLTRQNDAETYIRMLSRVFEFSATIDAEDIDQTESYLISCDAFMEPKKGKLKFLGI